MPRKEKDKSPKKKTKDKSPKKREDPAMDEAEINRRLLQNALDQANAKAEQKLEERLKALEAELTKKYQDERIELQDAFEQSRGEKPSTKETQVFKDAMYDAVKPEAAANHTGSSYVDKKNQIPRRFLELLQEYEYNPSPSRRGDAQLNLLFSFLTEMQIGPFIISWYRDRD